MLIPLCNAFSQPLTSVGKDSDEIDHVAMLVRCEDDSIAVIEATGNIGVEINPWKNFVDRDWVSLYKK
jgi:hypothetical protein